MTYRTRISTDHGATYCPVERLTSHTHTHQPIHHLRALAFALGALPWLAMVLACGAHV